MRLPSGEKRGSASGPSPLVSCFAFLPLAYMVQMCIVPERSLTKTMVPFRAATLILLEVGGDVAALDLAISAFLVSSPFFAAIVSSLPLTPDPSPQRGEGG